jgi:hypothetical protein
MKTNAQAFADSMAKERSAKPVCRHCGVQSVGTDDPDPNLSDRGVENLTLAEISARGATTANVSKQGS